MRLRAQRAGVALLVDVPATLPPCRAYPDDVEETVVNLLDNAIRSTRRMADR